MRTLYALLFAVCTMFGCSDDATEVNKEASTIQDAAVEATLSDMGVVVEASADAQTTDTSVSAD